MPTKTLIENSEGIYFITFTCRQWKPLIQISNGYDIVYSWFDYLKSKNHKILGYVIMPNHIHALISFSSAKHTINTLIGNGKRFMAYGIVKMLQKQNQIILLEELSRSVFPSDRKRNKKHAIWENSFDWKVCENFEFIEQKLDYIHMNPCSGNWALVEDPEDYLHSSASFYTTGIPGRYDIIHYTELEELL